MRTSRTWVVVGSLWLMAMTLVVDSRVSAQLSPSVSAGTEAPIVSEVTPVVGREVAPVAARMDAREAVPVAGRETQGRGFGLFLGAESLGQLHGHRQKVRAAGLSAGVLLMEGFRSFAELGLMIWPQAGGGGEGDLGRPDWGAFVGASGYPWRIARTEVGFFMRITFRRYAVDAGWLEGGPTLMWAFSECVQMRFRLGGYITDYLRNVGAVAGLALDWTLANGLIPHSW